MKRLAFLFLVSNFIITCSTAGRALGDGKVRVIDNDSYFTEHYRSKYSVELPSGIDTNYLFEKVGHIVHNKFYKRGDLESYEFLRFYNEAEVSVFYISKQNENIASTVKYDPEFTGNRGIVFKKESEYYFDLVGKASPIGGLGTYSFKFTHITNDTVHLQRISKMSDATYVYVRRPFPNDSIAQFKANW